MFNFGYLMIYWTMWGITLVTYLQGSLSVDFFIVSTLIMSAVAGGCMALLLYERSHRNRMIDARVAERVDELEQRYINTLVELESVRKLYNDRVAELSEQRYYQREVLVVEGPDTALHWDSTHLKSLGYHVTTLHNPTKATFEAHMAALRRKETTPYHVHFAMHGRPGGLEFGSGLVSPMDINLQMQGVRYACVAACESNEVAYSMRLIAGHTLAFVGPIDMDEAAEFVYEYYQAMQQGSSATESFYIAKKRGPADVSDRAIMA